MGNKSRPVIFGEVLFDCFPDGRQVLGGAPFNVAWHCQAFGLNPFFISRIGNDMLGDKIKVAMQEWGMDTGGVQVDEEHPTGKVEVSITNGEPSYDIVPDSAWDFIDREQLPELNNILLLYHGTLVLRNNVSQLALESIKSEKDFPVFVDINLRPPWWELTMVREVIKKCDWLKLNEDELEKINPAQGSLGKVMNILQAQYMLDLLLVTQGEKGATVLTADSGFLNVAPVVESRVADTVGAGDAFSSIILVGHCYDWPLHLILERAQEFASAIVGIQGATINDASFYQPFIDEWQLIP